MTNEDARALLLAGEVESDWRAVEMHLARADSVEPAIGPAEAALVALSLDHAYQAFESLVLRIDRSLGLPIPIGPSWHAEILERASLDLPGLRPACYPPESKLEWAALASFRHFLRHAYHVELDPEQLARNRMRLRTAVQATAPRIGALVDSLRRSLTSS